MDVKMKNVTLQTHCTIKKENHPTKDDIFRGFEQTLKNHFDDRKRIQQIYEQPKAALLESHCSIKTEGHPTGGIFRDFVQTPRNHIDDRKHIEQIYEQLKSKVALEASHLIKKESPPTEEDRFRDFGQTPRNHREQIDEQLKSEVVLETHHPMKNESHTMEERIFHDFWHMPRDYMDHGEHIKQIKEQLQSEISVFGREVKKSQSVTAMAREDLQKLSDIMEKILGFKPPLLHVFGYVCGKPSMTRVKEAIGVKMKRGIYSAEETAIIKRNVQDFMQKHSIENPKVLFGLHVDNRCNNKCRDILKNNFFLLQLAKDLNDRLLQSVYSKACVMYNPPKKARRCEEKEVEKITQSKNVFEKKCTHTSQMVCQPSNHLVAVNMHRGKGAWTASEKKKLTEVIAKLRKTNNLPNDTRTLPWTEIAKYVASRNTSQCRKHWLYARSLKKGKSQSVEWSKVHSVCLIFFMYSHLVPEENFVDWDAVFQAFHYNISYMKMRDRWCKLKQLVPQYSGNDHEEIVLYLYHNFLLHYLPRLKLKISDLEHWLKKGEFPVKCKL